MKKILFLFALSIPAFFQHSFSQCLVTNPAVELQTATQMPGGCEVIFNLSWEQEVNAGNKFAYIHLWRTDQYPNLYASGQAYAHSSDFPTVPDLSNALATIVIDGNGTISPVIGTEYHPIPAVSVLTTGLSVKKEIVNSVRERMTLRNIRVMVPTCNGAGITGDIWASQADNGKNVHCVSAGVSVVVGNPRVTGLLFCQLPRQYSIQITNVGDTSVELTYNVYIDEGDADYEPTSHDLKITSTAIGPFILAPGAVYQSGIQSYLPYSNLKPYSDNGLWVEVAETGNTHKTIYFISNSCIPLPVNFVSFSAVRDESSVKLTWETSQESDCYGFEIQKKVGKDFSTIAFVASLAPSGNSQSLLSYQYIDFNPVKSVSEYRIRQKDLNGHAKLTEIRFVRGMGQESGMLIYPNPSVNGQVNVLFDSEGKKDVVLYDNAGRLIRQWRAVPGTVLQISNLKTGLYIVKVINVESKAIMSKKFKVIF
ncbi:MAG TPA: T9SS type A sorting domain-containing protein [Chitinophagaceae bacterium]|nr:T9SS type A sorting domain-containing protein [Chitinophagaceae bacterium]